MHSKKAITENSEQGKGIGCKGSGLIDESAPGLGKAVRLVGRQITGSVQELAEPIFTEFSGCRSTGFDGYGESQAGIRHQAPQKLGQESGLGQ